MKISGARFHTYDRICDIDQKDFKVAKGDKVIIEMDQATELAEIITCGDKNNRENVKQSPIGIILRKATTSDLEKAKKYFQKSKVALDEAREEIKSLNLAMKLVDAHYSFDGSKITFYFTAEERVDFRELVKKLTRRFQKSIRMQQIGSRDVTKVMGGQGICGREICCHSFLDGFESITTEMVKLQQIAQGNEKISGACGRLMCCLGYEADYYREMNKIMPPIGANVKTAKGKGVVVSRNLLNKTMDVQISEEERLNFNLNEVKW